MATHAAPGPAERSLAFPWQLGREAGSRELPGNRRTLMEGHTTEGGKVDGWAPQCSPLENGSSGARLFAALQFPGL